MQIVTTKGILFLQGRLQAFAKYKLKFLLSMIVYMMMLPLKLLLFKFVYLQHMQNNK